MNTLVHEYRQKNLCAALGVSRSGYHDWKVRKPSARALANNLLLDQIEGIFLESYRSYGSPRMTRELRYQGRHCGENRIARLMRKNGLRARQKRRWRPTTTDSGHLHPVAPNLLAQREAPTGPNEVWRADITYVASGEGWLFLAGGLDDHTKQLKGWAFDERMPTALVERAFVQAVERHRPPPGLLHHSDRGSQYASQDYRRLLSEHGVVSSMSRKGNCYDNAAMESFWSTLKTELFNDYIPKTRAEAQRMIFEYIETFYNRRRLHSSLGYKSPVDFENNLN